MAQWMIDKLKEIDKALEAYEFAKDGFCRTDIAKIIKALNSPDDKDREIAELKEQIKRLEHDVTKAFLDGQDSVGRAFK